MLFTSSHVLIVNLPILEKLSEQCSKEQKHHVLICPFILTFLGYIFKTLYKMYNGVFSS